MACVDCVSAYVRRLTVCSIKYFSCIISTNVDFVWCVRMNIVASLMFISSTLCFAVVVVTIVASFLFVINLTLTCDAQNSSYVIVLMMNSV